MEGTQQGTLIRWDEKRGFGVLQPHDGTPSVFLHVTGLRPQARRPRIGDTVTFETKREADGKLCAYGASLRGVAAAVPRPVRQKKGPVRRTARTPIAAHPGWLQTLPVVLLVLAIALWNYRFDKKRVSTRTTEKPVTVKRHHFAADTPQQDSLPPAIGYTIKGNIAVGTGAKVYHVPGCEDYAETKIDPARGERWFRTEREARAAGWRKAPR